ncbi:MAG: hypothetical protein AAFQ88_08835, partial [Pseudomonadota bacterium]
MLGRFERLVDPYAPYDDRAPMPDRLIPFILYFLWPTRWVIAGGMVLGLIAAVFEAALVAFAAELIDILATTAPDQLWAEHWDTLLFMVVIALVIYPLTDIGYSVLMGQGFYPTNGALIRYRTHRRMLRQSLSFFADDFAGRIANKQNQLSGASATRVSVASAGAPRACSFRPFS